ncbi:acyl-CoA synthetase FdrA [Herbaspirillum sp. HC18]|nr:acyl-CoA synthetase FdrA [Herbaspirillum sp. HC18]
MLHGILIEGTFQDSVTLMLVSRDLSALPGVNRVSVMMGTPANKTVYRETGLWHPVLEAATPNDLCIVADSEDTDPALADNFVNLVKEKLNEQARSKRKAGYPVVRTWRRARQVSPDANLALISLAGHYVFGPTRQALEDGCNVMLFSDNVPLEDELALKTLAREKGLLVMGPDCGTAIVNQAPLAFANRVPSGPIAVVGASGTGIQEITIQIAQLGSGITHALGLGGRDLSEQVGGISALTALGFVAADPASRVIAFVSKPPAAKVKARVLEEMTKLGKPVVVLFLGERPAKRQAGNVHFAQTLDEVATLAVELAFIDSQTASLPDVGGKGICGLYTGGTLANEAAYLLADTLDLEMDKSHADGFMLRTEAHRVIDLGDDVYTRGRPHPMIDPTLRSDMIRALANEPQTGVLLLDIVLGYGGHNDPAGEVAQAVTQLREARGDKAPIVVIATMTGTNADRQDRGEQTRKLEEAGVHIADSVRSAILFATQAIAPRPTASGERAALLTATPSVVNIGLRSFADDLHSAGVKVIQEQWSPPAGGNERLQKLLESLK